MYKLHSEGNTIYKWINTVECLLNDCGFSYIWISQNLCWIKNNIKLRIRDQFLQQWYSSINNSSSCTNYRIFKKEFKLEHYLLTLPRAHAIHFYRFRLSNTNIPVVTGRY